MVSRRRSHHEGAHALEQPGLCEDARARRCLSPHLHEQLLLPRTESCIMTLRYEQASVEIAVADRELAAAIEEGIRAAIGNFAVPPEYPIVWIRTKRRLAALGALTGRI